MSFLPFKILIKNLSRDFFQAGHRTPRFSHINWAVCLPASCSHKDLELGIKAYLDKYSVDSDINIAIKVDEEMCQLKKDVDIAGLDDSTKRVM